MPAKRSEDYRNEDEYLLRCIEKAIELDPKDIQRIEHGLRLIRAREHEQRVLSGNENFRYEDWE